MDCWLVQMEWHPPRLLVCLPLVILPSTIKSRRSFLLAPAHACGHKMVVVVVWWLFTVTNSKNILTVTVLEGCNIGCIGGNTFPFKLALNHQWLKGSLNGKVLSRDLMAIYERHLKTILPTLLLWLSIMLGFYHASYASAVLGAVILSVCYTRALWLIQRTYRQYFYTTWKSNPSSQMWFFVQLCSSWQDFNWLKGSRGLSAATELLVFNWSIFNVLCLLFLVLQWCCKVSFGIAVRRLCMSVM